MAQITHAYMSIQKEKQIENSIALASQNKDTIEYLAMMSDIEIPTSDSESTIGGTVDNGTEDSQQEL